MLKIGLRTTIISNPTNITYLTISGEFFVQRFLLSNAQFMQTKVCESVGSIKTEIIKFTVNALSNTGVPITFIFNRYLHVKVDQNKRKYLVRFRGRIRSICHSTYILVSEINITWLPQRMILRNRLRSINLRWTTAPWIFGSGSRIRATIPWTFGNGSRIPAISS